MITLAMRMYDHMDYAFDNSEYAQLVTAMIVQDCLYRCFYELR